MQEKGPHLPGSKVYLLLIKNASVAQGLRARAALAEDLGLVLSSHTAA